jgi:hypothetical protein
MIRMAAEDIGLADPRALRLALDAAEVYERLGSPEGELALAECVVYLAVAPKSNAVYKAYKEANHPPVPKLAHAARLTAKPGDRVDLSAEGTTDPDGDAVSYEWFYYHEAGSFPMSSARSGQPLEIKNFDQSKAWFAVPTTRVMAPGTGEMHIILRVTDHGTPRLTRYQRVIVNVVP